MAVSFVSSSIFERIRPWPKCGDLANSGIFHFILQWLEKLAAIGRE